MLSELQKRKLTKLFSMYDANCDGVLVYKDFENMVKKLADLRRWSSRSSKYLILNETFMKRWKTLQKDADTSRNKEISIEEWLYYYEEILGDEKKYNEQVNALIQLVFDAFDKDGDGKISQEEWGELLGAYNISPVYAPLVFPKLDANGDGFLTKEELVQLIYDFYYSDDSEHPANSMFGPY
ncbi:EF-hand domain-containing protein [Lusitaniella coriacea]|uniref:EF-hand domain-containing protein n=1 Tax=Lusitaniella coriacea TaxID=1983105 RepID=UPI003CF78FCF